MEYYYKQPEYFDKFRCIGGDCPESCCDKWVVNWTKDEIDRLNSAKMTEEMRSLTESCFSEFTMKGQKGLYQIDLLPDGRCPFHNEKTGLCDIQAQLGEEYLSVSCRHYPRRYYRSGNIIFRSLSATCPAVLDILFNGEKCTQLVLTAARDPKNVLKGINIITDSSEMIKEQPTLKYRFEMLDFFCEILEDRRRTVQTSVILGALAAKKLSDAAENGKTDSIPDIIKALKPQLSNAATSRSAEEIKPNYALKFKLVNNMIVTFFGDKCNEADISALHDGSCLIVGNYLKGIENFNEAFKGREFALTNVIINTLIDLQVPLGTPERTIFENYMYFTLCAAVIQTIAAAIGYKNENIEYEFKKSVSYISRSVSHGVYLSGDIIDTMKKIGVDSPAHLALIIK